MYAKKEQMLFHNSISLLFLACFFWLVTDTYPVLK
jgi:hypothetical protein